MTTKTQVTKPLSRAETVRHLAELQEELEESKSELHECESRMDELEVDIDDIKRQMDKILDTMHALDITRALPTALKQRGFKLTEVTTKETLSGDLWGEGPRVVSLNTYFLEDNAGAAVAIWYRLPSLSDLLEVTP